MESILNDNPIISTAIVEELESKGCFIEANTQQVPLDHLKNDTIIPVFSKDNETTISHYQFIDTTQSIVEQLFPTELIAKPSIRVSHVIKGRVPSAIGKPAKELLEHEKTIYYERCAFVIEIPSIQYQVGGNRLTLTIGGVRAYNQENLYSKKTLEKFKVFIGFKNQVCTNLCISTDGFTSDIRISSIDNLAVKIMELIGQYQQERHIEDLKQLLQYRLSELEFAHLVGKARMYPYQQKQLSNHVFPIQLNDGQLSSVVKDYYRCKNFKRDTDGSISLWSVYNLLTGANKSSYIDSSLERNVNAYGFVQNIAKSMQQQQSNWYLPN